MTTTRLRLMAVRATFRTVGRVAPETAARWAEELFFRPSRARPRVHEEDFLATGRRFHFDSSHGRLAAWSWGEGPTVLLVHGWSSRAARFRVVAPLLVEAGYRVIAYDHPAHGASPGRRTSMVEVSATLLDVAAQTGPVRAAVGHSLGGAAIALALSRGLSLERAVLVAPFAASPGLVDRFAELVDLPDPARDRMRQNIEARFRLRFDELYIPRQVETLRTPVLVIHDREDEDIPLAEGEAIAQAWPGARMVRTRGLGHHAILRDPGVARLVADFVAGRPAPAG
jgi:pimeloyl-ACP methyl ester carboxylesterase